MKRRRVFLAMTLVAIAFCVVWVGIGGLYVIRLEEYDVDVRHASDAGTGQVLIVPTSTNSEMPPFISFWSSQGPYSLEMNIWFEPASPEGSHIAPERLDITSARVSYPDGTVQEIPSERVSFKESSVTRFSKERGVWKQSSYNAYVLFPAQLTLDFSTHEFCDIDMDASIIWKGGGQVPLRIKRRAKRFARSTIAPYWTVVSQRQ